MEFTTEYIHESILFVQVISHKLKECCRVCIELELGMKRCHIYSGFSPFIHLKVSIAIECSRASESVIILDLTSMSS